MPTAQGSVTSCFVRLRSWSVEQSDLGGVHETSVHIADLRFYKTYVFNTGDTKKRELLKCVVAAMHSWQHCRTGTLSYRQPRHFSNHGSDLKRQVIMVQFLSIIFFCWISSIFVGFFKSCRFFFCVTVQYLGKEIF